MTILKVVIIEHESKSILSLEMHVCRPPKYMLNTGKYLKTILKVVVLEEDKKTYERIYSIHHCLLSLQCRQPL